MSRFYAFIAGTVSGPFEIDELKKILRPELQVCIEGTEEWKLAGTVPELTQYLFSVQTPVTPPSMPKSYQGQGVQSSPLKEPQPKAAKPAEAAPKDLPPKLKELWIIARNAPDELLIEQKKVHWKKFHKNERMIIEAELARRGLN